jgi:hypothetical protein
MNEKKTENFICFAYMLLYFLASIGLLYFYFENLEIIRERNREMNSVTLSYFQQEATHKLELEKLKRDVRYRESSSNYWQKKYFTLLRDTQDRADFRRRINNHR